MTYLPQTRFDLKTVRTKGSWHGELVKFAIFNFMSRITPKVFDLESSNFTEMLFSMFSCAPGVLCVDLFSIGRVISLDLVKILNFQLVTHSSKSINFTQSHEILQES